MKKKWWIAAAPAIAIGVGAVFVLVLLLVKVLWAWTVPDIFPGAVEQGLVAARISWLTALKLAIVAAIVAGISGSSGKKKSQ